jgi:dTDP-4-amino-4,6-dideoxygalactose transaminase
MNNIIPFFSQKRENYFLKKKNNKIFNKIFLSGKFLQGQSVIDLEKKLCELFKAKYCICVNSCTDALFFSLLSLNLKKKDEVLVTNFSWIASASCIVRAGAKPVFVDINSDYNMNLIEAQKKITKKTKVLLYVHLFGKTGDLKYIRDFCDKNNLILIEDIAQTFSSSNHKTKAGTIGDLVCISFDPTKTISAPGSGGAVVTNSAKLYNFVKKARYHGKNIKNSQYDFWGYNSQMPSLTAAILNEKLKYNDKWIERRQSIARYYSNSLSKYVVTPKVDKNHVFHKYVILTKKRNALIKHLKKNNIESMIHYSTMLSENKYLKKFTKKKEKFKFTKQATKTALSLPIHSFLKKNEEKKIVKTIIKFFSNQTL